MHLKNEIAKLVREVELQLTTSEDALEKIFALIDKADTSIVLVGDGCMVTDNSKIFNIKGNKVDKSKKGKYFCLVISIKDSIADCECMGDFFDINKKYLITTHRRFTGA